ncbi:MAG: hypothetical protein EXQ94_09990 [Alphaproteobacteria bacterium]|nr:hypothetical protein [Alphaproteobacteria bacterium]
MVLRAGDVLETSRGGSVGVVLGDGTTVAVAEHTRVGFGDPGTDPRLSVAHGKLVIVGDLTIATPLATIDGHDAGIALAVRAVDGETFVGLLPLEETGTGSIDVVGPESAITLAGAENATIIPAGASGPRQPEAIDLIGLFARFGPLIEATYNELLPLASGVNPGNVLTYAELAAGLGWDASRRVPAKRSDRRRRRSRWSRSVDRDRSGGG